MICPSIVYNERCLKAPLHKGEHESEHFRWVTKIWTKKRTLRKKKKTWLTNTDQSSVPIVRENDSSLGASR
jgi:hypothetical protein